MATPRRDQLHSPTSSADDSRPLLHAAAFNAKGYSVGPDYHQDHPGDYPGSTQPVQQMKRQERRELHH